MASRKFMNQSAREQVISLDLTRIGKLASKNIQDDKSERAVRAEFYDPATNAFDDFGATAGATQRTVIPGCSMTPTIDGIAASFDVQLGPFSADVPGTAGTDESTLQPAYSAASQRVAWPIGGNPDPGNPRICLIVATPADALSDPDSRNILVSSSPRTVSPETVNKTSEPAATVSVVVGTAAATPVPPAVPAGAVALFEVIVPAAVADSTSFEFVRRAWRRIEFPGTSQHGIVKGCVPSLIDASFNSITGLNRIAIDGELLTFNCTQGLPVGPDATNTPGAAPSTNDLPTYLYLCGGRHQPIRAQTQHPGPGAAGNYVPLILLESTTPPDALGYPTASLSSGTTTFPRAACCYIGVRFIASGGTANVPAVYDGDWIRPVGAPVRNGGSAGAFPGVFFQAAITTDSQAAYQSVTIATKPAPSTAMRLEGTMTGGASSLIRISRDSTDGGNFMVITTADPDVIRDTIAQSALYHKGFHAGDTFYLLALGFNMNVPRLAS